MKITDKNVSFVLFFIPFLFIHSFAEWGSHGQRMRPPEYSDDYRDTSSAQDIEFGDSALPRSDISKNNITHSGASVYNASIIDYHQLGLQMPDSLESLAGVKRFRGTVVPGGDTIHFRVPVYGNISLENLEFSGVVYKDPEIFVETSELGNPYSFSSGLWSIISSAGGLVTLGFATEPLLDASSDRTEMIMLLACGYLIASVGQYFGVDKVVRHFRWNNQFGNR